MIRSNQRQQVSELEIELLRAALISRQSGFLIKYGERFFWAIICLDSLHMQKLKFWIEGNSPTEVSFNAIILPGTQGAQRTLQVIHPVTGKIVCARYIRFIEETYEDETPIAHFLFEVRVTGEQLRIPINKILPKFPSEIEKKAFDVCALHILERRFLADQAEEDFKAEMLQAAADEQRDLEHRMEIARKQSRFPLALPRAQDDPVLYPFFSEKDLRVLFLLLKILEVAFKPSYEFNLLVIRFLACGSQEDFLEELQSFSNEDEVLFKHFMRNYNNFFMGNPMTSRMQRCSKLTIPQVFLAQSNRAKEMRIFSQCALKIPREYFTEPEPEVELRKGPHDCILHSSLKRLE